MIKPTNKFVFKAEKIIWENIDVGDNLYVTNINGKMYEYSVSESGVIAKVKLLERKWSCRKFDLVKISCSHAMAALRLNFWDDCWKTIYKFTSPVYLVKNYLSAKSVTLYVVYSE